MQIAKEKAEDNGDSVFIEINKAKIAALKKIIKVRMRIYVMQKYWRIKPYASVWSILL